MASEESKNTNFLMRLMAHKSGLAALVLLSLIGTIALLAPVVAPLDPLLQDLGKKFYPPLWNEAGQAPYLLGTDVLGRDLLSRIIYGARISLYIGFFAVITGALGGIPLGMVSGFLGGRVDLVVMRAVDLLLAFPSLLLAIVIVSILGPSLNNSILAIGIINIPIYARVSRSSVLSEKQKEYVYADKVIGQQKWTTLWKGILRNIVGPLSVVLSLSFGSAILDAAGLSFLGLGAQPPLPEWGALITDGKDHIFSAPWLILYPGIAILFTVIAFNLLGDALRDIFDPQSRG